ncbi:MAG: hypothetical protein P1P86_01735 [Bacteroidales bacterium]|nr:hypothetical protein [Bacteroidales bacterium]
MLKRFIYAGLFAVVCLGLVIVFLVKRLDRKEPVEVQKAVPENAILFIEDIDYRYLTETYLPGSRTWIDFVNLIHRSELDSIVNTALGEIRSSGSLNELLLNKGLSLSLHKVGKDQLVPLLFLDYSSSHSDNDFEHLMLALFEKRTMMNERKYETEVVYDVSGEPGFVPGRFTFTCTEGLCLISSSSMLVEESIRTIHSGVNLASAPGFQRAQETKGKYVHANFYVNYKKLNELLHPFVKESEWPKLDLLSRLSSWGELDLDVKQESMTLNGMTYADPGQPMFLGAFREQSPVKMELHKMLPSGTSFFLHLGISNRLKFKDQALSFLNGLGEGPEIESESERISQQYGIDPLDDLSRIVADEMAWFAIEGVTQKPEDEFLILETRSRGETVDVVMHWVRQYLRLHSFDMGSLRSVYQLDKQTSFNIYKLPDPFFKESSAGRLFNEYFTVYENYLIFGPSADALSRVIYQNVLHKTFISDPVFKEISDYMSNRSNVTLFFKPYASLDYREDMLNDKMKDRLENMKLFIRRIPGVVVQFSAEGDLFYQSVSCKYTSQIKERALTVWESLMDTAVASKPALVINHNTLEKEIFVQDLSNKVYLINGTGRVLWKQALEGPILGSAQQVDFYRNGKLQYLFNTAGKIHLIDRNGNYVERYPISLRSNATNPLAIFDYDNSRNYRLCVATEDRKIYLYDIEGNMITGWRFGKTESMVTGEIQHFRIGDKDYIVALDQNRAYFLDRQGRERIRLKERVVLTPHNPLALDMNIREERPRWISTDTSGNVTAIYQDGSVSGLLSTELSPDHFFSMEDLTWDGVPEYIFADGNELDVVGQDGKRVFNYKVKERINDRPDIYKFSASDVKIGISDRSRNRIYLINSDGSLYEGFPLEGSTRYSIGYFKGSESRFNLIVGSENNFLYNYSIE